MTKTSTNVKKFIDEISWYINMPRTLQYMLPRIYSYSCNITKPYISMELYGYGTLHDLLIHKTMTVNEWKKIFSQLRIIIDDMSNFTTYDAEEIKSSLTEMYINKTIERLNKLRNDEKLKVYFNCAMIVNGETLDPIDTIIKRIKKDVKKILVDNFNSFFTIIHGDLCFPNILIEEKFNFLRLIDPRGSFGSFKLFGDKRYELAKILHSIDGCYDYIIEDLFNIEYSNKGIKYELYNNSAFLKKLFKTEFNLTDTEYREIRLIESLLFLSMIPLHNDVPERQLAMLITGLKIFKETIDD